VSEPVPRSRAVDDVFHSGLFMCVTWPNFQAWNCLGGHAEERTQSAVWSHQRCSLWNAIARADELCRKKLTVKPDCPRGEHQLRLGVVNTSCKFETISFLCVQNPFLLAVAQQWDSSDLQHALKTLPGKRGLLPISHES